MTDRGATSNRMPWQREAVRGESQLAQAPGSDSPPSIDGLADVAGRLVAEHTSIDEETASAWAAQATQPESRRDLAGEIATHAIADGAERAGIDPEALQIEQAAAALATRDGRVQAMRELGVHMSSNLAERYGVTDDEAERLMDGSRKLLTAEGRREVLASQTGDAGQLLAYVTTRGSSIQDRREAVRKLLSEPEVRGKIAQAGKGVLIGGVLLIVVLVGILIGAVALLEAIASGDVDAFAAAAGDATRPVASWFVGGPPSA